MQFSLLSFIFSKGCEKEEQALRKGRGTLLSRILDYALSACVPLFQHLELFSCSLLLSCLYSAVPIRAASSVPHFSTLLF